MEKVFKFDTVAEYNAFKIKTLVMAWWQKHES
jgi:hypothetical protein